MRAGWWAARWKATAKKYRNGYRALAERADEYEQTRQALADAQWTIGDLRRSLALAQAANRAYARATAQTDNPPAA